MKRHWGIPLLAVLVLGGLVAHAALARDDAPAQILITNVSVWNGTSDTVVAGVDVLVEENKIKRVARGLSADGAVVIDGKGGTVTPGLIDMHQHLTLNGGTGAGNNWDAYVQGAHASRAAEYLLRSGFTTIRDIAGNTIGLKRAINSGVLPGPRVYTAGPALGPTGGHQDWGSRLAAPGESNYQLKVQNTMVLDGVDQWLKGARWNLRNGADFLKVMSGGGVASEFDPIDLNSPSLQEMKAAVHNTFGMGNFPDWFTDDMREKGALVAEGSVRVPKWMKKHGVKMFVGSDMFGWDNWHNAIVNVTYPIEIPDSPFTSLDAMKLSTSTAGQALLELSAPSRNPFKGAKLGVVEEGAWADILIWKGDPTQNVKLILEPDNLLFIMKNGRAYKNLLVPPTHESFRGGLTPSGFSWSM
jgi:imidazolonepropionase-like amidohydrolase